METVTHVVMFGLLVVVCYYVYRLINDFIDHVDDDDVPPGGAR